MLPLLVKCPRTGRAVCTPLQCRAEILAKHWPKILRYACLHCGEVHELPVRDAFMRYATDVANAHEIAVHCRASELIVVHGADGGGVLAEASAASEPKSTRT